MPLVTILTLALTAAMVLPSGINPQSVKTLPLPGQGTRSPDDFELFLEGILEAPRGPQTPFNGRYVPASKAACDSQGPCAPLQHSPFRSDTVRISDFIQQLGTRRYFLIFPRPRP